MTTTIKDRRSIAPDTPDPAAEDERMRKRRAVREQAAERDMHLAAAVMAEADIAASEGRIDEATDLHATVTQPLQEELSRLEEAAIAAIADRQPPDAAADKRRSELVAEIAAANRELEETIQREREIQGLARQTARRIRQGSPPASTILAALAKPPLASPRLLIEKHIRGEKIRWLRARQQAAEKAAGIQEFNVKEIEAGRMVGDLTAKRRRLSHWQAELAAAQAELTAAQAESAAVHQRLLNE